MPEDGDCLCRGWIAHNRQKTAYASLRIAYGLLPIGDRGQEEFHRQSRRQPQAIASNRHSGSDVGSLFELELVGVEDDGERSVVHKLDLHIGTKTARLDTSHVGTDEVDEVLI